MLVSDLCVFQAGEPVWHVQLAEWRRSLLPIATIYCSNKRRKRKKKVCAWHWNKVHIYKAAGKKKMSRTFCLKRLLPNDNLWALKKPKDSLLGEKRWNLKGVFWFNVISCLLIWIWGIYLSAISMWGKKIKRYYLMGKALILKGKAKSAKSAFLIQSDNRERKKKKKILSSSIHS